MSIFTGTEVLFFILGVITTVGGFCFIYFKRNYLLSWKELSLYGLGFTLLVFTIAWSFSCLLENEVKAASMGLLLFGLPGLILLMQGIKMILSSSKKDQSQSTTI